ncbi:uncharacterized protein [Neodiprion pinetum]|uniref:uncharacterized protein n=1 Tax=Neodiprion pinetum TaxID=441929 RepID=UPI001EE1346C|nr:uncharacterized protein LOC124211114 [Neodiprion pinetum]
MPRTQSISVCLLNAIKKFPELYNSQHDLANDKTHSMVVWDLISYELNTPVGVLKKRWQKLRSSHKKRCRKLKSAKSVAPLPRDEIFHLMQSMLIGNSLGIVDDDSVSSAATLSVISEESRSSLGSSSSTLINEERRESSSEFDAPKRVLRPRNYQRSPEIANFETSENREHKIVDQSHSSRANEPVKIFFKSMALTVSKFPPHLQAETKTKICDIVVEAELKLSSGPKLRL